MTDRKTVCFSCLTPYHVFVSYILSKTVYKNDYKMILFSDHYLKQVYERSMGLKLWDKIILIEEKNKPWNLIQPQLQQIQTVLKDIDVLHYFSWGSISNSVLMNFISNNTRLILTDEGVMTYSIKEFYHNWKKTNNIQYDPVDFNRISEIWLFDTQLYISELNKPLKDIEFKTFLDGDFKFEFCNDLNVLFDYKHEKRDWDILFFDQPLALANLISYSEEKLLLMRILQEAKGFKLFIKKHPSDYAGKYTNLGVHILQCGNIPWEVVYLNEYIENGLNKQNKLYMTYTSSAMLNTRIIFKDLDASSYFITLRKLLKNFSEGFRQDKTTEKLFQKFRELYGKNFYEIESFEELKNVINGLSL